MENNSQPQSPAQFESQFRQLTLQLRDQYRGVEEKLDQVYTDKGTVTELKALEHINGLLSGVKDTEAILQPLRAQMQAAGESTPDDLGPIIEETIRMVSSLLPRFGEMEKAALEQRENLAPQISAGVRAAQMQSAYTRGVS